MGRQTQYDSIQSCSSDPSLTKGVLYQAAHQRPIVTAKHPLTDAPTTDIEPQGVDCYPAH